MAEANKANGLSVHDAVKIAAGHLKQLYPRADLILLEEVALSDDDRFWSVTLSFVGPEAPEGTGGFHPSSGERKYKILTIDRATTEVRSMKIREVAHV
jgi:hypothetical protein